MNPFEVAHEVTSFLEKENVEYFVGGSLASIAYGEPRFTQDVDIILRLSPEKVDTLVEHFQSDFCVSEPALKDAVQRKSSANLIHLKSNFKVGLIISRERPFEHSRFQRKTRTQAAGFPFWFCSAEDIILVKLEWYQKSQGSLDRQLRDVQTVLMVQDELDFDYLKYWADELGVSELLEQSLLDAGLSG